MRQFCWKQRSLENSRSQRNPVLNPPPTRDGLIRRQGGVIFSFLAVLSGFTGQAEKTPGWSHRQLLAHLCQSEAADRTQRRIERLLAASGLPEGKTLGNLDEALLPVKIRRQLAGLLDGGFIERSTNILAFGLPGRGKSHFLAALGLELILRHGIPVLFRPTFKLVGQLLAAKRDL